MAEAQFTPAEILSAHGNVETSRVKNPDNKDQLERGKALAQELKSKDGGKVGKSTFEDIMKNAFSKNEISGYEKTKFQEVGSKFGAETVTYDKTTRKYEGGDLAVESAKEGRRQVDKLTNILDYTSVINEQNKGKDLTQILKDKNLISERASDIDANSKYEEMKRVAARSVLETRGFEDESFSFLNDLDIRDKIDFIDQTLLRDPKFQSTMSEKIKKVQEEADKLKSKPEGKNVGDKAYDKWMNERLIQESKLSNEMDGVIPGTVVDVLNDRFAKVQEISHDKREKEEDDKYKKLTKAMDTNWINYDYATRSREVNAANLDHDITFIAYNGKEGMDRLLIRDLGLELKDEQGNPLLNELNKNASWEDIDFSKLSTRDKEIFEKAKEKYGHDYQNKLLADFGEARITNSLSHKINPLNQSLKLKSFEWANLNKNFGDDIENDINAIPGGKKALETLKANGIDRKKDKSGWLSALLFTLGLAAGGLVDGLKGVQDSVVEDAKSDLS